MASLSRLWWFHLLFMYLVGGRLVFETRLVEDGLHLVFVEVGDADGLDQPVIHQLLHSLRDMVDWCWDCVTHTGL